MRRNRTLELVYSKELAHRVSNTNVLVVGVGGIGCELLKVLTNSGYRIMTLLDLDSIEITNLNRQFYFRREHVGMSKVALVTLTLLRPWSARKAH
jgi:ubiquitin-like 1-activating enzyme E1 B